MRNSQLITAAGIAALLANENYKSGDFHQALLDIAYGDWQEHDANIIHEAKYRAARGDEGILVIAGTRKEIDEWWAMNMKTGMRSFMSDLVIRPTEKQWSYGEMLDSARAKYGELFFTMTLVGKYNQQVCNGGHRQYFDNGYGERDGGGFGDSHDMSLPLHGELLKAFEENILTMGIGLKQNESIRKAYGVMSKLSIEIDDDSESDNYRGIYNQDELDELDDAWYKVNEEFMEHLNQLCARLFDTQIPNTLLIYAASKVFENQLAKAKNDPDHVIARADDSLVNLGKEGDECYCILLCEQLRRKELEVLDSKGGGESSLTFRYRANRATNAARDLDKRIREMKEGDVINYWNQIADVKSARRSVSQLAEPDSSRRSERSM